MKPSYFPTNYLPRAQAQPQTQAQYRPKSPRQRGRMLRNLSDYGFSLVELMVGMTIGLIGIAAMATIYSSSTATNRAANAMARAQEDVRYLFGQFKNEISRAGANACPIPGKPFVKVPASPSPALSYLEDFGPISGIDGSASELIVHYGDYYLPIPMPTTTTTQMPLTSDLPANSTNNIALATTANVTNGAMMMIANCKATNIFKATSGGNSVGHAPFATDYNANDVLTPVKASRYYLGDNTAKSGFTCPLRTVCRLQQYRGSYSGEVLAENVSNLKFTYIYSDQGATAPSVILSSIDTTGTRSPVAVEIEVTMSLPAKAFAVSTSDVSLVYGTTVALTTRN